MATRDLHAIQEWFEHQHIELHMEHVFKLAKVRYAIMTNNPFIESETVHWVESNNKCGAADKKEVSHRLKTALRIDTSK